MAFAQDGGSSRYFVIPSGPIECRHLSDDPRDAAAVSGFEFELGDDPLNETRTVRALYAADGAPVQISETITRPGRDSITIETIAVRFSANGSAKAIHSVIEQAHHQNGQVNQKPVVKDVSSANIDRGRELALWLWKRGCEQSKARH